MNATGFLQIFISSILTVFTLFVIRVFFVSDLISIYFGISIGYLFSLGYVLFTNKEMNKKISIWGFLWSLSVVLNHLLFIEFPQKINLGLFYSIKSFAPFIAFFILEKKKINKSTLFILGSLLLTVSSNLYFDNDFINFVFIFISILFVLNQLCVRKVTFKGDGVFCFMLCSFLLFGLLFLTKFFSSNSLSINYNSLAFISPLIFLSYVLFVNGMKKERGVVGAAAISITVPAGFVFDFIFFNGNAVTLLLSLFYICLVFLNEFYLNRMRLKTGE